MEKLISIQKTDLSKRINEVISLIISMLLGYGAFMCFVSSFSLSYKMSEAFSGSIIEGMKSCFNEVSNFLGQNNYIIMDKLASEQTEYGLFLSVMLVLLILLSYIIVKSKVKLLLLVYPLCLILGSIFIETSVSIPAVFVVLLGLSFAVLHMGKKCTFSFSNFIYVLVLVLLVTAVINIPLMNDAMKRAKVLENFDKTVEEKIDSLYYGENLLGGGTLSNPKKESSEETALNVTMQTPDALYLRGYVGETFVSNAWLQNPNVVHYRNRDLTYWLNEGGLNPLGQISSVDRLVNKGVAESTIDIEVENANKEYAYVPYEISQNFINNANSYSGSFVGNEGMSKLSSYSYNVYPNATSRWTVLAGEVFTMETSDEVSTYLLNESHINEMIYANYTYISSDDKKVFEEEFTSKKDLSKGHISYKVAISEIRKFFDENFIYTENVGASYSGDENILGLMLKAKKGYDAHYATLATMMFRYFGIPARYVEGYLVTPELIEGKTSSDIIEVPRNNNHAWTEIYIDGVGFVPIEVCENYYGVMPEADLEIGIDSEKLTQPFVNQQKNKNPLDEELKESEDDEAPIWLRHLILIVLGLLLLIVLVLLLIRLLKKILEDNKRRRLFNSKDINLSISAIYDDMIKRNLPITSDVVALGNRASYSKEKLNLEDRVFMLLEFKQAKRRKKSDKE